MKVFPVIIGALGTTPSRLPKRLKEIGINTKIVELQKTVISLGQNPQESA